jgi:hypothetical protein
MPPTLVDGLPPLLSPEELQAHYKDRITARAIRRLVTQGRVAYTKGASCQVLFAPWQVTPLLAALAVPAAVEAASADEAA